ncbi:MAG TPA: hypothetical protein PK248_07545 [Treponemataceae bacterium]|jgi:hypothetical protein|nr:hypothetical protein [Spirochaetota bacterium]NMA56002.1 hypothetical protein [Treponema sp.]HOF12549.1 hypothetical protein [Treponemataceae bacterium]HPM06817.1 hypothetical protein [Treponemataceae bacterium]
METYVLKGHGNSQDCIRIMEEINEGYIVKIIRDRDGFEDISTDFLSRDLFESCLRTGYLTKSTVSQKKAITA